MEWKHPAAAQVFPLQLNSRADYNELFSTSALPFSPLYSVSTEVLGRDDRMIYTELIVLCR